MKRSSPGLVCVVVALDLEAKPMAEAWTLKRLAGTPFGLYQGELPGPRSVVRIVVSGVGRTAAAAATGWLAARCEAEFGIATLDRAAWLNFGIGGASRLTRGHAEVGAEVGAVTVASKVIDEQRRLASERTAIEEAGRAGSVLGALHRVPTWYPPCLWPAPGAGSALGQVERTAVRTVDRPELRYPDDGVYEMEAAGFMEAASRFATAELVQVMKVVSDTSASELKALDRSVVRRCAETGVPALGELAVQLVEIASNLPPSGGASLAEEAARAAQRLRLTVAQTHQWHREVERLCALAPVDQAHALLEQLAATEDRGALATLRTEVDKLALQPRTPNDTVDAEQTAAQPEPRQAKGPGPRVPRSTGQDE